MLERREPGRVLGLVALSPTLTLDPPVTDLHEVHDFEAVLDTDEGWAKENRAYWKRDWEGYIRFYIGELASEPHSTKVYDDMVGWGLDTDAETMLHDDGSSCSLVPMTVEERAELCRSITCPVLAIAGTEDRDIPPGRALRLAELTGGDALMIEGGGHLVHARHPVVVNHAIKAFVDRVVPPPPRVTPVALRPAAAAHRALGVVADRPGPRAARPRDRPGRARAGAGPADRVAGPVAGDGGAGRGRRDRAPGQRRARLGGGALGGRGDRPRPARVPCLPQSRRDLLRQLPALRRGGPGHAVRPLGGRRVVGGRTTSCTRTPSARSRRTSSPPTSSGSCRSTATPARRS